MKEYEKMSKARQEFEKSEQKALYAAIPEIKIIDDEIAALAVRNAARVVTEGISPEEAVNAVNSGREKLLEKRNSLIKEHGFVPQKLEYNCTLCGDTGTYNGQNCKCYMDIMKKILLSNIDGTKSVSFDLEKDKFENFSLNWYSKTVDSRFRISPYDNMKSVYAECRMFCDDFKTTSSNLYFCGSSGTGKTFMASCIANELISKGVKVVYQSSYKLFQFMEDFKFCRIDREENQLLHDSIYNADLLIIDDLGTEFGTAYTCSVLFDILNTRILNEKSTIISSNLNLDSLEKKYTERVASRIIGNFEILRFFGDDIRIAKKQSGR
jgi:DNA replication protein DnaC